MPLLITFYSWISPGLAQRIVCWRPCTLYMTVWAKKSVVFSQKMPLLITWFYSWISLAGLGQRIICWRPCTWHWCDVTFGRSDLRSKTAWWLHFDSRPTFDTSQDHQQTQPSWKNTGTMSGPMSNCRMLIQNMEVCICLEILFLYYVHSFCHCCCYSYLWTRFHLHQQVFRLEKHSMQFRYLDFF